LFVGGVFAKPAKHHTSNRAKTVHVKSYTKKNGQTVQSYDRATPSPK
jgi:hypothetical protein